VLPIEPRDPFQDRERLAEEALVINRSERCAPLRRNLDEGILVNIAVLYICTGEYWRFWQRFRESAAQHLLLGEHVRYFVFSDQDAVRFPGADVVIPQDNLGWPMNTLYRFRMFLRTRAQLQGFDNVIFFNAVITSMKLRRVTKMNCALGSFPARPSASLVSTRPWSLPLREETGVQQGYPRVATALVGSGARKAGHCHAIRN
jgi:hypothetical protein